MRCEDYPCCGHTPLDPCERQWYDEPGAFDTSRNPHALCEHEYGLCDVEPDWDDEDGDEDYADGVVEDAAFEAAIFGDC
jgi:hypothetical protein